MRLIHSLQSRRDREEGFTLIELMVVVLIIAILIAIAIPTFLGARERAQDSAAKSDLRNALAAAKVFYTDTEDYSAVTAADLEDIEPSLEYVAGAGTTTEVGFDAPSETTIYLERESKSGKMFCVAEDLDEGTTYGSEADCDGSIPLPNDSW
ncbi:MAG: hypothetical protein KatS3mg009_2444 [Acidimicrobiia bacterium]|nr:MAG: hypothetical protein KatS3mg009_2444 [Acidimicrobiia bacterium]